jgi:hypothetical protein
MSNAEKKSMKASEDSTATCYMPITPCFRECGRHSTLDEGKGLLLIWSVECHGAEQDTGDIKIAGCSYTWNKAVREGFKLGAHGKDNLVRYGSRYLFSGPIHANIRCGSLDSIYSSIAAKILFLN